MTFGAVHTRVESFGPAYPTTCTRCGRKVALHYSRRHHRRALLFLPTSRAWTTHVLSCPSCFHDDELDADQGAEAEALTRTLAAFRRGDLPEGHYRQHMTTLWHHASALPAPAVADAAHPCW